VELQVAPNMGRLPTQVETALFRIVQESLTNVQRHAGSARASIRLAREPERVILEVSDQGTGLSVDALDTREGSPALGVGIPGMRQRILQLGGELAIHSSSCGTTVTAVVPINRPLGHES
jgi:two-component system NarL family sensor kinase